MPIRKFIFLTLTVLAGILLLHHHLYYQPLLSQGDHGRDLYAAQVTLQGAVPYRDYWWVYGPLMPYYYAAFFKIFGITIKSILLGKFVLNLLSGIFFFLILSPLIPPLFAFAGTLWLLIYNLDFFFTYNHVGGITVIMATVYCLLLYIRTRRRQPLYYALLAIFILCLIKINFGIIALIVVLLTVLIHDEIYQIPFSKQKGIWMGMAIIVLPALVFLIYAFLFRGSPTYEIRQCLPYLKGDQPYEAPVWITLWSWWEAIALNINTSWANRLFAFLLILSIVQVVHSVVTHKFEKSLRHQLFFTVGIFIVFYALNLHEYLVSGVIYRAFWSQPFSIMLIFLFLGIAAANRPKLIQFLLFSTIFFVIFLRYSEQIEIVKAKKLPEQYLALERGQIITGNDFNWFNTVEETTQFLQRHLNKDELFFALPYDAIYYYLTDKPSPSRQLIFFDHIKIPPAQEESIIGELEQGKVNYVLLSNRMISGEPGLGVFGETYCPIIAKYIQDNFKPIATFGDWTNHPGWAWNHGTTILQRKDLTSP